MGYDIAVVIVVVYMMFAFHILILMNSEDLSFLNPKRNYKKWKT